MSTQAIVSNPTQIHKTLFDNKAKVEALLPAGLDIDRFMQIAWGVVRRNPRLLECTPESIIEGIGRGAQLGLSFDPTLGQACLVPYWNSKKRVSEAQFQPMYRGHCQLAYRSGQVITIFSEIVHREDRFELQQGTDPKIVHVPKLEVDRDKEEEWIGVYAVAKLKDGFSAFRFLTTKEVYRSRDCSKTWQNEKTRHESLWAKYPKEAWLKTPIPKLAKLLPQSPDMEAAIRAAIADEYEEAGVAAFQEPALPAGAIEVEPQVAEVKAAARNTIMLRWGAEGANGPVEVFPVPDALKEQVKFKDLATRVGTGNKTRWLTVAACIPDMMDLCDSVGYDLANTEPPQKRAEAPATAETPSSGEPPKELFAGREPGEP